MLYLIKVNSHNKKGHDIFHKAICVEYKEGTLVEVTFSDGITKQFDLSNMFEKYPQLKALKDRELFTSGILTGGYGIIWNNDLDIEVETIYQDGKTIE